MKIGALFLALLILIWLIVSTYSTDINTFWLSLLIGILLGSFIRDAYKQATGQKVLWNYLTKKDKMVLFILITVMLIVGLFPMKSGMPIWVGLITIAFAHGTTWVVIQAIGSEALKKYQV